MFRIKISPLGMAVVAALIAAAVLPITHAKEPAKLKNPIASAGKTSDGKYPIYDLKGDLNDLNYASSNGVVYNPDDLIGRINWLQPEDAKGGPYACEFICKDKAGHVVGLNPAWKKVYGVK